MSPHLSTTARRLRALGTLALAGTLMAGGCSAGPDLGPTLAVDHDRGGRAAATTPTPRGLPQPATPGDVVWGPCPRGFAPSAIIVECAELDVRLQAGRSTIHLLRARLADTPTDTAPAVLVSGPVDDAAHQMNTLLTGAPHELLAARPVVSVGRHTLAEVAACVPMIASTELVYQEDPRTTALTDRATSMALSCGDTLRQKPQDYSVDALVNDLERVREAWQVDNLSLLAVGDGALVARHYAGKHPDRVARLVLDAPTDPGVPSLDAAHRRLQALASGLDRLLEACHGAGCAFDGDRARLDELLRRKPTRRENPVTPGALRVYLEHVSAALPAQGPSRETALRALGGVLAAADRGDGAPLAAALRPLIPDGVEYVYRCGAEFRRPGAADITAATTTWDGEHPGLGRSMAMDMYTCQAWSALELPALEPPRIPTLVIAAGRNPRATAEDATAVNASLAAGGTTVSLVRSGAFGHGSTVRSTCVQNLVSRYFADGSLPAPDTVCAD